MQLLDVKRFNQIFYLSTWHKILEVIEVCL